MFDLTQNRRQALASFVFGLGILFFSLFFVIPNAKYIDDTLKIFFDWFFVISQFLFTCGRGIYSLYASYIFENKVQEILEGINKQNDFVLLLLYRVGFVARP